MRLGVVLSALAAATGCRSIDDRTESARRQILALSPPRAARIVAFCTSWHRDGAIVNADLPRELPIAPTSAVSDGGRIAFQWWNNSHWEEDDDHPGFELICSDSPIEGARSIASGLWYRDAPTHGE